MFFGGSSTLCCFLQQIGENVILVAYGSQQRSGYVNTAMVGGCRSGVNVTEMGTLYILFDLEEKTMNDTDLRIEELQRMTKVHCLLLPFVFPNVAFAKQFGVVYGNWGVDGINGKTSMTPCNTILNN